MDWGWRPSSLILPKLESGSDLEARAFRGAVLRVGYWSHWTWRSADRSPLPGSKALTAYYNSSAHGRWHAATSDTYARPFDAVARRLYAGWADFPVGSYMYAM